MHNVDTFSELSLAVHWCRRLSKTSAMSKSTNLMTSAVIVENLAEKVDGHPLNLGR